MAGMRYQVVQDGAGRPTDGPCEHLDRLPAAVTPGSTEGCEDCLRNGTRWVHLRECLTCGHIGCCDSSPEKHASAHWRAEEHPLVRSFEPGEDWAWCYADELVAVPVD
ncbi:ubiquitin carboxyl-terminal hydrolase 14 [Embleya sp. NBC_00896]|uniref:ubiquitin carboxyl-terminal hydrolase 14 n=1 Tax=Embleya sp. NBC_00896 TaxID=2975961 RepID=UPI00386F5E9E|nr:UBP-type zinc finger domain-containing protein [Embleya sp. NBC_00896]